MYPYTHDGRNVIFSYLYTMGGEVVTAAHTKSSTGMVTVTYALCSNRDIFTKARGRQITLGRLAKGQILRFEYNPEKPMYDQVMDLFPHFSATIHRMPDRVVSYWVDDECE